MRNRRRGRGGAFGTHNVRNIAHVLAQAERLGIHRRNFEFQMLHGMAAAAIVTGNSVLIKPSDQTPVIAAQLMELLVEAGFPPGVANLITGPGSTIGARLVAHPQIDFIAFTGSKEVGLRIWETACAAGLPPRRRAEGPTNHTNRHE